MQTQNSTESSAAQTIRLARYKSPTDNRPIYFEGTFRDAIDQYSRHQRANFKGGSAHNFAELRPGSTRATRHVQWLHAGLFDIDHEQWALFREAQARIVAAGLSAVASSTFSHQPNAPRLRLLIQLSRPVTAAEWSRLWSAVNQKFALHADEKSRDAAHLFFDPSAPEGAETFVWVNEGNPLSVDALLKDAPAAEYAPARTGIEWHNLIEDIPSGERDSTLTSLAGRLFGSDLQPELAYSLLHTANEARCKPPLPRAQVDKIASSIAARERRNRGAQ